MSSTILAVDLGKFNSVFCWYEPDTRSAAFRTTTTGPDDLRRELTRRPVAVAVFEACSQAGWVHDLCEELKLPALVASTTGAAWQWKHVKRKTDRDDALKLARLAAVGEVEGVPVPPRAVRQWKSLIGLRKRLVSERVRCQNRIRGLLVCQGLSAPIGAKAWTETGLAATGQFARPLADCGPEELWRGELHLLLDRLGFLEARTRGVEARLDAIAAGDSRVSLLATIPGVGPRTAEVIAVHLYDARRFHSAEEVSAYAGLVPRQYQSGETDRRGRITRRGPKLLRAALVECAWCSLRYNEWARETWLRLQRNGCSKKKAIVALARKLLVRCWAILKTGQPWREPASAAA
ncbi:MAG TPA: IS110 family transposase [Fimbriiglobus sp.]|jgi:transposase|nr:IS110 family transposase [Fimbriiglobus sp.]